MKKFQLLALSLLTLTILGISGCATSPTGRSQFMIVSPESAIAQSKEAYVQTLGPLEKEGKIDSNPATAKRVRLITGRLIAQAVQMFPATKDWEWSVKVIDDPKTVNAWCMAGGKMAIYTGLLEKVKPTDDELAEVMGHEISHALANHTAEKMSTGMAAQLGGLALGIGAALALGDSDNAGTYIAGSSALAAVGVTLPNSRTAETEADEIGIKLAAKAGYDPRAAATLWQKMGEVGGDTPPQFLSTHPSPENRQERLAELANKMMPYYNDKSPRPIYKLKAAPVSAQ